MTAREDATETVPKRLLVVRCPGGVTREQFGARLRDAVRRADLRDAVIEVADPRQPTAVADAIVRWSPGAPNDLRTVAAEFGGIAERVGGYAVEELVQWEDAPGAAAGYTMIAFSCRRPGLTREEFVQRYRAHAAVARVHHPGVRRYVQSFVTAAVPGSRACEAIAWLHFADAAAFSSRLYLDEESRRIVAEDVAGFLDRSSVWTMFSVERIPAPPPM